MQRDCGRPPEPRKDPGSKPEEEGLLSDHPYVNKVSFFFFLSVGYEFSTLLYESYYFVLLCDTLSTFLFLFAVVAVTCS